MSSVSHKILSLGLALALLSLVRHEPAWAMAIDHDTMYLLDGVEPNPETGDLNRYRILTYTAHRLTDEQKDFITNAFTIRVWQLYATTSGGQPTHVYYTAPMEQANSVKQWNRRIGGKQDPRPGETLRARSSFAYDIDGRWGESSCMGYAPSDGPMATLRPLPGVQCFTTPPPTMSCNFTIPDNLPMGVLATGQIGTARGAIDVLCSGSGTTPLTIGPGEMSNEQSNLAVSIDVNDACVNGSPSRRIIGESGGTATRLYLCVTGSFSTPGSKQIPGVLTVSYQ